MFTPTPKQEEVIQGFLLERYRQNKKWGSGRWTSGPHSKNTVLIEEVGEVSRAILNKDRDNLREELIQVAAVCMKWLEALDDDPMWDNEGNG